MSGARKLSPAAEAVLGYLAAVHPGDWSYGYAIARHTQIKSGTLYPILARLSDRGLLEAIWEEQREPGIPRRHLYRLTGAGVHVAAHAATADRPRRARLRTSAITLPNGA